MWLVGRSDRRFVVIDQVGAIRRRYDSGVTEQNGEKWYRTYSVELRKLIESTRHGDTREVNPVMGGLFLDRSEETRRFLAALDLPFVSEALERQFVVERYGGPLELGELVRRAQDALTRTNRKGRLRDALARGLLQIGRADPGEAALTAYARACLLACGERDELPEIDERWVPVASPIAEQVAELATMLDDGDQGDAADAMHTCAVLLGYRPRK